MSHNIAIIIKLFNVKHVRHLYFLISSHWLQGYAGLFCFVLREVNVPAPQCKVSTQPFGVLYIQCDAAKSASDVAEAYSGILTFKCASK